MSDPTFRSSVRMTEKEVRQLLWRLANDAAKRSTDDPRRNDPRVFRQVLSVPVAVRTGEEAYETYRVPLLDLSGSGCGLVFGRFVHPGAVIKVALFRLDKQIVVIEGLAQWCRLYRGCLHRVGVQWDRPIDVSKYSLDVAVEKAYDTEGQM